MNNEIVELINKADGYIVEKDNINAEIKALKDSKKDQLEELEVNIKVYTKKLNVLFNDDLIKQEDFNKQLIAKGDKPETVKIETITDNGKFRFLRTTARKTDYTSILKSLGQTDEQIKDLIDTHKKESVTITLKKI